MEQGARKLSGGIGERRLGPIDRQVGYRLRLARKAMNLSQEALAERLGVTFQQLQKYEKGVNRISAGRLHSAALILGVPVSSFFPAGGSASVSASEPQRRDVVTDLPVSSEGIELNLAYSRIKDLRVRRHVLQLIRSIAADPD